MPQLADVRACLDLDSMRLLDTCAAALEEADLFELLLEQLERLVEGLEAREASDDDTDIVRYGFSPMGEMLLRDYLWIATDPYFRRWPIVSKRTLMLRTAQLAGYA